MAGCTKEINQGDDNLFITCLSDDTEFVLIKKVNDVYQPFRTTYATLKACLIPPPSIHFTVGDESLVNDENITYPLGGGDTFFSSSLIGRRSVIVMVNNVVLPQRPMQQDYCTPNFNTGEITRPDGFKVDDYIEIYIL